MEVTARVKHSMLYSFALACVKRKNRITFLAMFLFGVMNGASCGVQGLVTVENTEVSVDITKLSMISGGGRAKAHRFLNSLRPD
jgi:hypothetical protein